MKKLGLTSIFCLVLSIAYSQEWKEMMYDYNVNFYDVCAAAETYFEDRDKGKGSGWKDYQRWRWENEAKYYPSGDRSTIDHSLPEKEYQKFLEETGKPKAFYDGGWESLGPYSIDIITTGYNVGLGRIETFYVDPADDDRLYIGSRSGGFWYSLDGGADWTGSTTQFLIASGVNTMTVRPGDPNDVLINLQNAQNQTSHGLYRSTDGGNTWTESNFNPTTLGWGGLGDNDRVYKVRYHPTIADLVFVCTSTGVYRSDDDLATWTTHITTGTITEIEFHPTDPNIVYVYNNDWGDGERDYVWRSLDAGLTWSLSNIATGNSNASAELSASGDCPDCLFFASNNGLWKSWNQGMDWTFVSNPPGSLDGLVVNDLDTSVMVAGYLDIYKSLDGGNTWSITADWTMSPTTYWTGDYTHADLRRAKSYGGVLYLSTDGLFSRSYDNGTSWEILTDDNSIREFYNLGVSQSNHYRTIVGSQDNGTSINRENGWLEFFGADGMEGFIHPLQDDYVIGSYQYGGRLRTLTGGYDQTYVTPPPGSSGAWIAPIMYDPDNQMRVYSMDDDVWMSDDFGDSWTLMGGPATSGTIDYGVIAENNTNTLIATNGSDIEISYDQGGSWTDIEPGLPNSTIRDVVFDPNDDNTIAVVYGNYQDDGNKVFISTDGGSTWTNITYNLNNMPCRSIAIDHTPEKNIYVGAEIGVYTMPMGGTSWALYNTDLPNMSVRELEVMRGTNTLRAATWGNGLWEWALVGRNDYPAIVEVWNTDKPTIYEIPTEDSEQMVQAIISYQGTLTDVWCEYSVGTPAFNNSLQMFNHQDSTWITKDPIPDFAAGTSIFFRVLAVGDAGDTTVTYKFQYETKASSPYCGATGTGGTGSDYIDNVILNGTSNPTGQDYYGDYTSIVIELWEDSTYTLDLELNWAFDEDTCGAWIDYSNDQHFSNDEYIIMGPINMTTFVSQATITIPDVNIQVDQQVTMRVRNTWDDNPDPCGSYFGEVEDYSIIIRGYPDIYGYMLSADTICSNESFDLTYCGEAADSIVWTFSNGTDVFSFTGATGTMNLAGPGDFDLDLTAWKYGEPTTMSYTGAIYVYYIDPNVTVTSTDLTADQAGVTYQWIDCGNGNLPITGATSQTYTPGGPGTYAVILTTPECSDTSDCYSFAGGSIIENSFGEISIYPNPNSGQFTIDISNPESELTVQIFDVKGSLVFDTFVAEKSTIDVDIKSLANGVYYVHLQSGDKKAVVRVSKTK